MKNVAIIYLLILIASIISVSAVYMGPNGPLTIGCNDTDGQNYNTSGNVTYSSDGINYCYYPDKCLNMTVLREFICSAGQASYVDFTCAMSCLNRTCASGPTITLVYPADGYNSTNTSAVISIQLTNTSTLQSFAFNWSGNSSKIYDTDLVLSMNFDNVTALGENSTSVYVNDSSLARDDGICSGMVTAGCNWVSGKYGSAIDFSSKGFIDISDSREMSSLNSHYTMMAWIKSNRTYSSDAEIINMVKSATYHYYMGLIPPGKLECGHLITPQLGFMQVASNVTFTDDNWHFVACTYNGSHMIAYLDGVLTNYAINSTIPPTGNGAWYVGRYAGNSLAYFNATIDEIRVWNRSLSGTEISQLYKSSLNKYSSDGWTFTANQSNLSVGTYTYGAYAGNTLGLWTIRTWSLIVAALETIPPDVNISVSPSYPNSSQQLTFAVVASDASGISNLSLYVNNTLVQSCAATTCNKTLGPYSSGTTISYYAIAKDASPLQNNASTAIYNITVSDSYGPSLRLVNPQDGLNTTNKSVIIQLELTHSQYLSAFVFNWDNTNFSVYGSDLVLMMNFDNVSALGESPSSNFSYDASSYGNNGTCHNANSVCNYTKGKYGAAWQSYGGDDVYISVHNTSSLNFADNYTISIWIKTAGLTSDHQSTFISKNAWASAGWAIFDNGPYDPFVYFRVDPSLNYARFSRDLVNDGAWHNIVAVYDGDTNIYLDGGWQHSGLGGYEPYTLDDLYIGGDFNGSIDEIRVWNRSLSGTEISQLYKSSLNKYSSDGWTFTANQTNLSVGTYAYSAYARNWLGSLVTQTWSLIISYVDAIPPSVNISVSPRYPNSSQQLTFTAVASDASGISNLSIYVNNTLVQSCAATTCNKTLGPYPSGTVLSYYAVANDASPLQNNASTLKYNISIFNMNSPSIKLLSPQDGLNTSNNNVTIRMELRNASYLSEFRFGWNNINYSYYDSDLVLMMNLNRFSSLGEGSNNLTYDASLYGNNGSCKNMGNQCNWTKGYFNNSLYFDGATGYVDLGNPSSLRITGSMSVAAWVYHVSFPADDGTIISKDGYYDDNGWDLKDSIDNGARTFAFAVSSTGSDYIGRYSNTTVNQSTWYFVVGTYNASGQTLSIYVNGVLDDGILAGTVPSSQKDSSVNATIGNRIYPVNPTYFLWNGKIDEVMVWNRTLSPDFIAQLYRTNIYKFNSTVWNVTVNKTNLPGGNYSYGAYAKNLQGLSTSKSWKIQILANDTTPPAVNVTHSPTIVNSTINVTFIANATDSSGIYNLKIYVNGTMAKNCSTAYCTYVSPKYASGLNISYYSVATDNSSRKNVGYSLNKSFVVQ